MNNKITLCLAWKKEPKYNIVYGKKNQKITLCLENRNQKTTLCLEQTKTKTVYGKRTKT